jgi:hypothetical protein
MLSQADDVMDSQILCYLDGTVRTAVVHHQVLDGVHPRERARQVAYRLGESSFFIIAGNLDDEFHRQALDRLTN